MAWIQSVGEHLWVGGGALLTVALGLALLYWADQEWRARDREQPPPPDPAPPHVDSKASQSPDAGPREP